MRRRPKYTGLGKCLLAALAMVILAFICLWFDGKEVCNALLDLVRSMLHQP